MHQTTANRFMHVAERYGDKISSVLSLEPSALYELAAPKTPPEVREEVERMIAAGEIVNAAVVKELRAKLSGQEPTKAALREAVVEAARQGLRGR